MTTSNPLWKGVVRPFTPKKKATKAYAKEFDIGRNEDSKAFTVCKVWAHAPTFEFPTVACFISFNNGAGSAYSRLKNPQELREIAANLATAADELDKVFLALAPQQQLIEKQLAQYEQQQSALAQIAAIQQQAGLLAPQEGEDIPLPEDETPAPARRRKQS